MAGSAVALGTHEAYGRITSNHHTALLEIQPLARRADTGKTLAVVNKILRCKVLGGFLGLMPIGRLKPGIALSKQNVGYIAVNLLFKQHLHVLFGVKARRRP